MGGLKTAFIHNEIRQQSSFIPRCLGDYRTDEARKTEGETTAQDGRAVKALRGLIHAQIKSYIFYKKKNVFLIYCPRCCTNNTQKGSESNTITVLVLLEWPQNVRTNIAYFITLLKTSLVQLALKRREDLRSCG